MERGLTLAAGLALLALTRALAPSPATPTTSAPPTASGSSATAASAAPTLHRTPSLSAPRPLGPADDDDAHLATRATPVASYRLEARYQPSTRRLQGSGTITWVNQSRVAVSELYVHLYLNAFKNDATLFLRSPYGAGRSGRHAREYGYIDVRSLKARQFAGEELWAKADTHSPGDPADQTDIRVPLPQPVDPGAGLTLELEFEAQLPGIVERTGVSGDFTLGGQWFPKLARLEPEGTWKHFAFHPQSEFYADYGDYDVTLEVPAGTAVTATGQRVADDTLGGRRRLRFQQDSVHDFAWCAWKGAVEEHASIDGVQLTLLYPPGRRAARDATWAALQFGLPHYSRAYGRYPYPTLSVVHPPEEARDAGGMEYPTFITTGGPWYATWGSRAIEMVTLHELGHQWFYGLLASNEHEAPFLDEGLNSWAEARALEEAYGPGSLFAFGHFTLSSRELQRALALYRGHDEVVASAAHEFSTFSTLGALAYSRTSTILATLGGVWGEERLARALGRYARAYRFQHPTARHFLSAIRDELGEAAAQQLERALFDRGWVDYSVTDLSNARATEPAGVFDGPQGRETRLAAPASARPYQGRVLVRRHGSLRFPVDVELTGEDGSVLMRHWDGQQAWQALEWPGPSRLVRAVVDPERRIALDQDRRNDVVTLESPPPWATLTRLVGAAAAALAVLGP